MASRSMTRRLIVSVLLLELLAATALIAAITVHERHVQLQAFDANLKGYAQSLMGAVQDAEDTADNVMLDMRGVQLGRAAVYRVQEDSGRILGVTPELKDSPVDTQQQFQQRKIGDRLYRLYTMHGLRIIDPGLPNGGVPHSVTVAYGMPVGHVWHEVWEAIRFSAVASVALLGLTSVVMVFVVRRELRPIHALAAEAERVGPSQWDFHSPEEARATDELRPLTSALEAALTRLRKSFEQQRRFTSDAAHELKTDVAIVKSSLQLLSMRKRTGAEYERGVAVSLEDFTRLENTIQRMLTLARLERPEERPITPCLLGPVIEDAMQQSAAFAELKSIKVAAVLDGNLAVGLNRSDAMLLCSNLLVNALQHSPEAGTVNLELGTAESVATFKVRDEGPGISEEDRPYLFEAFYRGDPSRSRKSGGTGLGLSICKAICERAGGSIVIENGTHRGAIVTVTLPVA